MHIHSNFSVPTNEPIYEYLPNSLETKAIKNELKRLKEQSLDIPMIIGGKEVFSKEKKSIRPPHDHKSQLATYNASSKEHIEQSIRACADAKKEWMAMAWEDRAKIFLKAAELLSKKYRFTINATTMLGQSKNVMQAEIDSACELIDFLRFNVHFLNTIYTQQPLSTDSTRNVLEYRPLEGFVVAISPFNFTAIGGNLPTAPAMCGNTIIWKPSTSQIYSAYFFMKILEEAGIPSGVINLIYPKGKELGDIAIKHQQFSGLHFTGSTQVFEHLWKLIGENIKHYKDYPRIVGETGGKDFIIAHHSASVDEVVSNIIRGSFEFQGQKCSAASRVYLPSNISKDILDKLTKETAKLKMGSVEDFSNFVNAVIDENAFDKISTYIDDAKQSNKCKIIAGGNYNKQKGYFIEPTIILTEDPKYTTMCEEIFGPVVTIFVYQYEEYKQTLDLINTTSPYALTGAVFARDKQAIKLASDILQFAAGNFYINDKPTGAVVGQQPFGGGRKSGTNDKAGSMLNLYRWLSPRTIKENYLSPTDWKYPFLG